MGDSGLAALRRAGGVMKTLASVVLLAFTLHVVQPLSALAQSGEPGEPAASAPASAEERLAQLLQRLEALLEPWEAAATLPAEGLTQVNALGAEVRALDREVLQNFADVERDLHAQGLPAAILARHAQARASYEQHRDTLLAQMHTLVTAPDEAERQRQAAQMLAWLRAHAARRPHQPFDPEALPVRLADPAAQAPPASLQDMPARRSAAVSGQGATDAAPPQPADLAPTEEVQLTAEIRALAQQLHHNPVEIYNWIYHHIAFMPTYGAIQSAPTTLERRRGNAIDTASLLMALLRASGIPARYVQGTVQMPIEKVMNWVGGVTTPAAALTLLGQGGIPVTGLAQGGAIQFARLEHIWVEAYVDFYPSRGAVNQVPDTWVPLDASFKQFDYTPALNVPAQVPFDAAAAAQQILSSARIDPANASVTGLDLEFAAQALQDYQRRVQAYLEAHHPSATFETVFGRQAIKPLNRPVLAAGLPYQPVTMAGRWSELPGQMRHSVTLELFASATDRGLGSPSLAHTLPLSRLGTRRLGITYVPASPADARILATHIAEQATSLPLYLIQVKPVIKLDEEVLAEGPAVGMGSTQYLDVVLASPQGPARLAYSQIAGDEMVLVINAAGITAQHVTQRLAAVDPNSAAENLHQIGLQYWAEADLLTQALAAIYGVRAVRLPSAGLFTSPLSVIYSFGFPNRGYYLKRGVDIKRNLHAAAGQSPEMVRTFVSHLGTLHSYLEGSILEQVIYNWQGTGLSTAQVLLDANAQGIPLYQIDPSNASHLLPQLSLPAEALADIRHALHAGLHVIVPQRAPAKAVGAAGIGYVLRDPDTGAGSYRISGGLDGGEGEAPCAEPQVQPLAQAVRDVVLTIVILAVLAAAIGWSGGTLGGLVGTAGGRVLGPVLSELMAAFSLEALTFSATAQDLCTPINIGRHLGGNKVHDDCADRYPPNEFFGSDACVMGHYFDAVSGGKTILWEVKTENYNHSNDFVRNRVVENYIKDAEEDVRVARGCNFNYYFLVGDSKYRAKLTERFPIFQPNLTDSLVQGLSYCVQP